MGTLALVALLALSAGGDAAPIHWGERTLKIDALPADCPESARGALEAWHGWSTDYGYRLDLDKGARILLVSRRSNDRADQQLELGASVIARFDQELPAPPVRRQAQAVVLAAKKKEEPPRPAGRETPLPEDPEDPEGAHPWKLAPPNV